MPPAAKLGSLFSPHACFPPTIAIQGATNVIIEGSPAHRLGDNAIPHPCICCGPPHGVTTQSGSPTVIVQGSPQARILDVASCGSMILSGAGTVIIG